MYVYIYIYIYIYLFACYIKTAKCEDSIKGIHTRFFQDALSTPERPGGKDGGRTLMCIRLYHIISYRIILYVLV